MKQVATFIALFALFSLINANGNAPGNCLLNASHVPGPGLYSFYFINAYFSFDMQVSEPLPVGLELKQ